MMQFLAKFFSDGGPFMFVVLGALAFAIAVALERFYFFHIICKLNAKNLFSSITRLVRSDKAGDASKLCKQSKAPLAAIMETALWSYDQGFTNEEIQNAVDETALRVLPLINKRLQYIGLLANVATLLGLLGTITGLMAAFSALAAADPSQKSALLTLGISEALNTTALGILVGVFCMILFSILTTKASAMVEEVDEYSVRLLNFLFMQRKGQAQ